MSTTESDGDRRHVEEITKAAFARLTGLSRSRVTQLTAVGAPLADAVRENGSLDRERAERLWAQYRHPGRGPSRPPAAGRPPANGAAGNDDSLFAQSKTRRAVAEAEISEMRLAQARGDLISAREVHEAMVTAGRRIRQSLDRVPGLAEELTALARAGDVGKMRAFLRGEVRKLQLAIVEALTLTDGEPAGSDPLDKMEVADG